MPPATRFIQQTLHATHHHHFLCPPSSTSCCHQSIHSTSYSTVAARRHAYTVRNVAGSDRIKCFAPSAVAKTKPCHSAQQGYSLTSTQRHRFDDLTRLKRPLRSFHVNEYLLRLEVGSEVNVDVKYATTNCPNSNATK